MGYTPTLVIIFIFAVIFVGFQQYIKAAWQIRPRSWSFNYFFLGGRRIGADLTKHTSWGLTFAWSNGIWFFAYLAYQYGPGVILLQLPWCISTALLAFFLKHIMRASQNYTVHGYIGSLYGDTARKIACIATTIGYVFNCGFEIFVSSLLFSLTIGNQFLIFPTAIVLSIIFGSYCMIGGYMANCRTDKSQAILGMIAVSILCLLTGYALKNITGALPASVTLFVVCIFYSLSGYYFKNNRLRDVITFGSIIVLVVLILFLSYINSSYINGEGTRIEIFASSVPPWSTIIGISTFQLFFNSVDMANWQTISANSETPEKDRKIIGIAFVRSAVYMLWFPALSGILLGCFMRVFPDLTDQTIFPKMFSVILPDTPNLVKGLVFGFIFLGLLSTSLSSADSYLMAAINTLSWDLFKHKEYVRISRMIDSDKKRLCEVSYIDSVRNMLIPLSLFMTLTFAGCFYLWKDIFAFQFIMYGSSITLFPCIMYGLFLQSKNYTPNSKLSIWVVLSITTGILFEIIPYFIVKYTSNMDISSFAPILGLLSSSVVFIMGWLITRHYNLR